MHVPAIEFYKKVKHIRKSIQFVELNQILAGIENENDLNAFYASRIILSLDKDEAVNALDTIKLRFNDVTQILKISYLQFAICKLVDIRIECKNFIMLTDIETVVSQFEYYLTRLRHENISWDDNAYPEHIANSMYGHLSETFSLFPSFIKKLPIPKNGNSNKNHLNSARLFISSYSHYVSLFSQIIDTLYGHYQPTPTCHIADKILDSEMAKTFNEKCKHALTISPAYWRNIEIYRDLCYKWNNHHEEKINTLKEIMTSSGAVREYGDGLALHINMLKENDFSEEMLFYKVNQKITVIYGDSKTTFTYQNREYYIHEITTLCRKIHKYYVKKAHSLSEYSNKKGKNLSRVYGIRSFCRIVGITDKERDLLPLLTFLFTDPKPQDSTACLLLGIEKLILNSPTLAIDQSYEKIIDKILSRDEVSVHLGIVNGKGYVFEDNIRKQVEDAGYLHRSIGSSAKVSGKPKQKAPEIDGIFMISENFLIIYEAKCSIKPESRAEAYTFMENHLSKAAEQLSNRLKFIKQNPEDFQRITGLAVDAVSIIPIIVTNHSYFSGVVLPITADEKIYVLDLDLFVKIICKGIVPQWIFDPHSKKYRYLELKLSTDQEKLRAISDVTFFLRGTRTPTYQISEHGVAYEIFVDPEIDYLSSRF